MKNWLMISSEKTPRRKSYNEIYAYMTNYMMVNWTGEQAAREVLASMYLPRDRIPRASKYPLVADSPSWKHGL